MSVEFDIAVVGAGPAGGNAALAAAAKGLSVVLLDEQPAPGGQVWRAKSAAIVKAPLTPETRAGDTLRREIEKSAIDVKANTRVWQIARDAGLWFIHTLNASETAQVTAKKLILASGAREFVQPVPGWTTPGVMGLAGATALFKQHLFPPGKRAVISGTGPLVFYVASEVRRLGGTVAAVVTPNTRSDWFNALPQMVGKPGLMARGAVWMADLMLARVPIFWGHAVTEISGEGHVAGVDIAPLGKQATSLHIPTDSVCMGHGLIPQVEAAQMLGVGLCHDPSLGGWVPEAEVDGATQIDGLFLCGDGTGIRGADAAVHHGRLCGLRAARELGKPATQEAASAKSAWKKAARFGRAMTALSISKPALTALSTDDTIICRCESLTKRSILAEVSGGANSTNAVKSGVRAGMGPCGGKYCQTVIARMIAARNGVDEAAMLPPTARPPLRPVPVSAAAGAFEYDDLPVPKPAPL